MSDEAAVSTEAAVSALPEAALEIPPPSVSPSSIPNAVESSEIQTHPLPTDSYDAKQLQVPEMTSSMTSVTTLTIASSEMTGMTSSQVPVMTSSQNPVITSSQTPAITSSQIPAILSSQTPAMSSEILAMTSSEIPAMTSSETPATTSSTIPKPASSEIQVMTSSQTSASTPSTIPKMTSSSSAAASTAPLLEDPPTPDYAELMHDIDRYDEATLDRVLKKLAAKAEAAQAVVDDGDILLNALPPTPPPPPPPTPPPTPSLSERLLAIFPDACPDWVRREAAEFEAATADASPEPLVTRWLTHGYRKRVKKWRQQLEQQQQQQQQPVGEGQQDNAEPHAARVDPDEGTLFDWRRQRRDIQLRQPVFDALVQEFPSVAMRSVSQVVKAFKYCLPAAYRFLYKSLSLTGHLMTGTVSDAQPSSVDVATAVAAASVNGDETFASLPFDCPQQLEVSPSGGQPEPTTTLGFALRRRASELERRHPEVVTELRFVRCLLAADGVAEAAVLPQLQPDVADQSDAVSAGSSSASAQNHHQDDSAATYECECCFGDFAFDAMCQCPDGHLFCRACLAAYVKEKVFGVGRMSLQCLAPDCDRVFLRSQLCLAVDAVTLAKLDERAAEDSVRCLAALFRCPSCGWGAEIPESGGDENDSSAVSKVFACQNCEKEVCRLCGVDWDDHFGLRCSEIELDSETRIRREFEEKMTQARVRICYQCKASVMKSSGCNHITCRCGAHFCYICRGSLSPQDPYSHFCNHGNRAQCNCGRCPVESSTEEDDQRAIKEIRAQGVKRQRDEGLQERPIGAPDQPKRARRQ